MMKNLNEEIESIKYLIDYNRNKILLEEFDESFNLDGITPEELKKFQSTLYPIRIEACKKSSKLCTKCTTMISEIGTGKIKNSTIKKCFDCEKKMDTQSISYQTCVEKRGELRTILSDIQKEKGYDKKNPTATVGFFLGVLSTLQSLVSELKNLFSKEKTPN